MIPSRYRNTTQKGEDLNYRGPGLTRFNQEMHFAPIQSYEWFSSLLARGTVHLMPDLNPERL